VQGTVGAWAVGEGQQLVEAVLRLVPPLVPALLDQPSSSGSGLEILRKTIAGRF